MPVIVEEASVGSLPTRLGTKDPNAVRESRFFQVMIGGPALASLQGNARRLGQDVAGFIQALIQEGASTLLPTAHDLEQAKDDHQDNLLGGVM